MKEFQKLKYFISSKENIQFVIYTFLIFISMSLEILSLGLLFPIINLILDVNFLNNFPIIKSFLIFISPFKFLNKGIYFEMISGALTFFLIVIFLKNLISLYIEYFRANFVFKILSRLKTDLLKKIFNISYKDFIKIKTSEFVTFQNQIGGIVSMFENLMIILTESVVFIGIIFFLFFLDSLISFYLVLIILFFSIILIFFLKKKILFLGEKRRIAEAQQLFLTNNILNGIKEIKLQNRNEIFTKNFDEISKESLKSQRNFKFFSSIPRSYLEILVSFSIVLYFTLNLYFYSDINKVIASATVFLAAGIRAIPSMGKFINSFNGYKYYLPVLDKIFSFCLKLDESPKDKKIEVEFKENFELKNISFSFDKKNIFKNLNFEFKNSEKIGFYGSSGIGKSTLINIIAGLLSPQNGSIKVDKELIKNKFYLKNISLVPQSSFFINSTIRENLTFTASDNDKISDEDIFEVLNKVKLDEKVKSLSLGLDTIIGERGSSLSGGQLQRLSIARALLKKSDLLILDESTNAIDKETEKKILDDIFSIYKNKCLILISHDINLLKRCDQVYEIKNLKLEKKNV